MGRSILFLTLSLALLSTGCAGSSGSGTPVQRPSTSLNPGDSSELCVDRSSASAQVKQLREEICQLTNLERAKAGVAPLILNDERSDVAQGHAEDMVTNNFFSHTSSSSGSFTDRLRSAGVSFSTAGENIARNTVVDSEVIMSQWMNSSGHRANILKSGYGRLGVGYASGRWVQVFTN